MKRKKIHWRTLYIRKKDELESVKRDLDDAKSKAEYYKKRFREFGTNVETVDEGGDCIKVMKWTVKPQTWGTYITFMDNGEMSREELEQLFRAKLLNKIAEFLVENEIVKYITRLPGESFDPLAFGTAGAKLYVIPWDQMPHKRTIELTQYVENIDEGEVL
jgi:hypothetical protein